MSLNDLIAADAALVFCDAATGFAEQITYTPRGGSARSFPAQVFRQPYGTGPGGRPVPALQVFVPNSADPAVGVPSVDKDGDRVTVAERQGGAAAAHPIAEITSQDAGGWLLTLR